VANLDVYVATRHKINHEFNLIVQRNLVLILTNYLVRSRKNAF